MEENLRSKIKLLRKSRGLTQEDVAGELGIPRSAVSEIENGDRAISAIELHRFAKLFGLHMQDLLEQDAEEEEMVMLRAEEVSDADRIEFESFFRRCSDYAWVEHELGEQPPAELRRPESIISRYDQVERLAAEERHRLVLGATPARRLLQALEEQVGVKVFQSHLEKNCSGVSASSKRFGNAVLVNEDQATTRRLFSLAHEYFHLLTRGRIAGASDGTPVRHCVGQATAGKSREEKLADWFAGHLLLPNEAFVERLGATATPDGRFEALDLVPVARHFGVSVQAVFVRSSMLKMIDRATSDALYQSEATQQAILDTAAEEPPFEPKRFGRLCVQAYKKEAISKSRLAQLLGKNLSEVDTTVAQYGGSNAKHFRVSVPS